MSNVVYMLTAPLGAWATCGQMSSITLIMFITPFHPDALTIFFFIFYITRICTIAS